MTGAAVFTLAVTIITLRALLRALLDRIERADAAADRLHRWLGRS